ncbi:hypothetical protein HNR44_000004 [Geomicrobium halophilum]|uniref:Uncharacterized protein n=1 Tax=Geomicrobium halophilum TaxID=549000 RepID=A0A841PW76_9BACL|nr:hypothetical protein [Geomicrobium halophilum]MBB6448055.1 hypothetical protein [Geomicrobium halophilum]
MMEENKKRLVEEFEVELNRSLTVEEMNFLAWVDERNKQQQVTQPTF